MGELLGGAADRGELFLDYQPICNTDTGDISGVETLLRWHSGELGRISPADFIPVAERTGAIIEIGGWVLRQSIESMSGLLRRHSDFTLHVNVAPLQLFDPHLVGAVEKLLQSSAVSPSQLVLEITESAITGDASHAFATLTELRDIGVGLAIDDFGSGQSSLARLYSLPFTKLKIDKSIIDSVSATERGRVIVDSIVDMAHKLGLAVVAEGVESADQQDALRAIGCDKVQGFLLHKPISLMDLQSVVAA